MDTPQPAVFPIHPLWLGCISNATLNVNVSATPATDLIIARYTTLNGEFGATNGIDSWAINYSYEGNQIALIPPASGTVLIIR